MVGGICFLSLTRAKPSPCFFFGKSPYMPLNMTALSSQQSRYMPIDHMKVRWQLADRCQDTPAMIPDPGQRCESTETITQR